MTLPTEITCASCNLRYDELKIDFTWRERKHVLAAFLLERRPDVLATQEGWQPQLYRFAELIQSDYVIADSHRDYRDKKNVSRFIRRKDWNIQHSADRWLSLTPTIMSSTSFGSQWPKLTCFAQIKHTNANTPIIVSSFHLDNVNAAARPQQAKVLLQQLERVYPAATDCFVMGDANDLKNPFNYTIFF